MSRKMPILRVAGPTFIISLVLFGACMASAVFLYRLQKHTTEGVTDDIEAQKLTSQIEERLKIFIDRMKKGKYPSPNFEEELAELVQKADQYADTDQEWDFTNQLTESYAHFQKEWNAAQFAEEPDRKLLMAQALRVLETDARPQASKLHASYTQSLKGSEEALRGTVKWIAWGLAGVGVVGSLGGILLGFSVARALRQSIYLLSVRIRDAADRLGQDLPTVTISSADGIEYLNEQMKHLVTEIDDVVNRLQQREREVLRAEQLAAVGQLAAGVAHELRNPLTSVKMLVQASREDFESKGLPAEDLQIIEQEIRRLERSLQTFLDFARPPKMERRSVDLGQVLDEALVLVSGRAKKQKVDVEFASPSSAVFLEADPDQLRQLFVNLALNALDVMTNEGKLIIKLASLGEDRVEIRVSDTGPGIAADIRPRLFEPFVSGKETGLGLGLVVSRRIAEEHGGALTAENLPGGGACFTLRLPVLQSTSLPSLANC